MLAREVMATPVVTVGADEPVMVAVRLLDSHEVTAMPVVDAVGGLVGIVSEADILHEARESGLPSATTRTVRDVMTWPVLTVREDDDAVDAATLMLETGVLNVPVTRGRVVVGMIRRGDLVHVLAARDDRIRTAIRELLDDALEGWDVRVDDGFVVLSGVGGPDEARLAITLARTVAGVENVRIADERLTGT